MIAMAWRSLYAETVKARIYDKTLNMKRAVWTWDRLTLSRVKAYGNKWYKWYVTQRLWQQKKTETIPEAEQYIQEVYTYRVRTARRLLHFVETQKTIHGKPRRMT